VDHIYRALLVHILGSFTHIAHILGFLTYVADIQGSFGIYIGLLWIICRALLVCI